MIVSTNGPRSLKEYDALPGKPGQKMEPNTAEERNALKKKKETVQPQK
jgi:hypothetical protein